ncbi:hypothetical protein Tco_1501948 [Tanacetum coccineum]
MEIFKGLESHLKTLYPISVFFVTHKILFESTFRSFFGEEHQNFRKKLFHNLDQLRLQFERGNLYEVNAKTCLEVLRTQFKEFFASKEGNFFGLFESIISIEFKNYTGCEPETYRSNLLVHPDILEKFIDKSVLNYDELRMKENKVKAIKETEKLLNETIPHGHEIEQSLKVQSKDVQIKCCGNENSISKTTFNNSVNERQMQMQEGKVDTVKALDVCIVVTESSRTESEKHDTSSRSENDTHDEDANIRLVNDEEPMAEVQLTAVYDVLAKEQQQAEQPKIINDGRVDQDAEKCQDTSPLLDLSPDNKTTEFLNQSLESENIFLKKTIVQFQKDFLRMEAHCVNLELKYQNLTLNPGQHANKENEHLKQTYKDLYDSIKKTRVQTKDHTDSMIVQLNSKSVENADLKAHIQEKVFTNAALKNELRKLKGNSVDAKFAKPSILGKPTLQPLRNQSVVRQPNAFKSERPKTSKPRFASQVDVKKDLSKPVTTHYLPKEREFAFAKPRQVIASSEYKNSSKNMLRFSSNDMVHNHYLDEARKKTQEKK